MDAHSCAGHSLAVRLACSPVRGTTRTRSRTSTAPTRNACSCTSRAVCSTSTSHSTSWPRRSPQRSSTASSFAARPPSRSRAGCSRSPAQNSLTTGATAAWSARRSLAWTCRCRDSADPEIERIEDMAGLSEVAAPLAAAMDELPREQRMAVELRVVEECGYADIALRLGISEQAARARVSRGLRALALALREPEPGAQGRGVNALDELRENFREAARRDIEARARSRRRRRRLTGLFAVVLVGGDGRGGRGRPHLDRRAGRGHPAPQGQQYRPAGKLQITLTAPAPDGEPAYGLAVFTANNGDLCAIAGRVRGAQLGEVKGNFHPYKPDHPRGLRRRQARVRGHGPVRGQLGGVRRGARGRALTRSRAARRKPLGRQRAFLFVYRGKRPAASPISYSR